MCDLWGLRGLWHLWDLWDLWNLWDLRDLWDLWEVRHLWDLCSLRRPAGTGIALPWDPRDRRAPARPHRPVGLMPGRRPHRDKFLALETI